MFPILKFQLDFDLFCDQRGTNAKWSRKVLYDSCTALCTPCYMNSWNLWSRLAGDQSHKKTWDYRFFLSFSLQLSHLYALQKKKVSSISERERERERERDLWICLIQGSMLMMNKKENRNFATTRTKPRERQRKEEQWAAVERNECGGAAGVPSNARERGERSQIRLCFAW